MNFSFELAISLWGATVATILAIKVIVEAIRDKPRIGASFNGLEFGVDPDEQSHGVIIEVNRGGLLMPVQIDIEVFILNSGTKPTQITGVFVESELNIQYIYPEGLPTILEPRTSIAVRVQPEWFFSRKLKMEMFRSRNAQVVLEYAMDLVSTIQ